MAFLNIRKKAVSRQQLQSFWKDFISGKRIRKPIASGSEQKVIAVSRNVIGTVRNFGTSRACDAYVSKLRNIEKKIIATKPRNFKLIPIQLLSKKGGRLLERVYLAPSLGEIAGDVEFSRYTPSCTLHRVQVSPASGGKIAFGDLMTIEIY